MAISSKRLTFSVEYFNYVSFSNVFIMGFLFRNTTLTFFPCHNVFLMQILVSCFVKTSHFEEYLCVKVRLIFY